MKSLKKTVRNLATIGMLLLVTTFAPAATTGCSSLFGPDCEVEECSDRCPCPAGLQCTAVYEKHPPPLANRFWVKRCL